MSWRVGRCCSKRLLTADNQRNWVLSIYWTARNKCTCDRVERSEYSSGTKSKVNNRTCVWKIHHELSLKTRKCWMTLRGCSHADYSDRSWGFSATVFFVDFVRCCPVHRPDPTRQNCLVASGQTLRRVEYKSGLSPVRLQFANRSKTTLLRRSYA